MRNYGIRRSNTDGDAVPGDFAPRQGHSLIRRILPRRLQPLVRGLRKRLELLHLRYEEPYRTVYPYTLVSHRRQQHLTALARRIDAEGIPGCLMECGVLDGGTAALTAWATLNSKPERAVHLFDSWQGLPKPTTADGRAAAKWGGDAVGSPRRVRAVMRKLGVDPQRLHLHKGWFQDTFDRVDPGSIALLHIDADFYESVRLCLERWYGFVSPGGFIQIDDYDAFSGCRRATDEFVSQIVNLGLTPIGSGGGVWFIRKPV